MTVEERAKGKVSLGSWCGYARAQGWAWVTAMLCSFVAVETCQVSLNVWIAHWSEEGARPQAGGMDEEAYQAQDGDYLRVYLYLAVACVVAAGLRSLAVVFSFLNASKNMYQAMLRTLLNAPVSFFDVTPTGRILNRLSADTAKLDDKLPNTGADFLTQLMSLIGTVVIISLSVPAFLLLFVFTAALAYRFQDRYRQTARDVKRLESTTRSPVYSNFGEALNGLPVLSAFGLQEQWVAKADRLVDTNYSFFYTNYALSRWFSLRAELVGLFVTGFVALYVAAFFKDMKSGDAGLALLYSQLVVRTLQQLLMAGSEAEVSMNAVERILHYSNPRGKTNVPQEAARTYPPPLAPTADWPRKGRLVVSNLSCRYRPGLELMLKDISFSLGAGKKLAVVGRTGSGKSSLALALFRIMERAGGSVELDGQDIAKVGLRTLRSRMCMVPQAPMLWSGTVRYNLDPFAKHADQRLKHALTLVQLGDVVEAAGGLDAPITEKGGNWSVGQRQLLCLARAVLHNARVLVLDEASASLDPNTDRTLQRALRTTFRGCTVLTIAHRLQTVMDYDAVLVLERGELVEYGPPGELLQARAGTGAFARLVKAGGAELEASLCALVQPRERWTPPEQDAADGGGDEGSDEGEGFVALHVNAAEKDRSQGQDLGTHPEQVSIHTE